MIIFQLTLGITFCGQETRGLLSSNSDFGASDLVTQKAFPEAINETERMFKMFCSKCGKENQEGAKFCNGCGASLSNDKQSNYSTTSGGGVETATVGKKRKKSSLIICSILGVVVVIVIAFLAKGMIGGVGTDDASKESTNADVYEESANADVYTVKAYIDGDEENIEEITFELPKGAVEEHNLSVKEDVSATGNCVENLSFCAVYDGEGYKLENLLYYDTYGNGYYDANGLVASSGQYKSSEVSETENVSEYKFELASGYSCVCVSHEELYGDCWEGTGAEKIYFDSNGNQITEEEILTATRGTGEYFFISDFIEGAWPVFK